MGDQDPTSGAIKLSLTHLVYLVTTVAPLWGLIAYGFNYEEQLVKKPDIENLATSLIVNQNKLDTDISLTEIKLLFLTAQENLPPEKQLDVERLKAKLIRLEAQRDEEDN